MPTEHPVPETRVLAIASHVVSGHVGNKIAVFAMQSLGCDVAALNTVQFSNHTGYRQWKGTRITGDELWELYEGLRQSYLNEFDMMLSGYLPGAAAVESVGRIAEELRHKAAGNPGSFFWVLDPVMGDNGRLYVAPDVLPAYKKQLSHADLILPNQFEAELLSDVKIESMNSLQAAIQAMHERYKVPHIIITSVSLEHPDHPMSSLSVVGSSMTSTGQARLFKIVFPAIDCYFSGTGDMFGALMVVRMREAITRSAPDLLHRDSWLSDDSVAAVDLPLARAAEKVLASMHEVLAKTCEGLDAEMKQAGEKLDRMGITGDEERAKAFHLLRSGSAELRLPRNVNSLKYPKIEFRAVPF
ncbi:pyridoxine kinase [Grosmannia clavigera kw1407]|uniref:pyridoxal kinase n=1 Tax=Grosmannia clavigera (strain kw1407 / UAMH 11150) TaxID=655863 RepID=F0XIL8_GROCL|nr:pyridoxine kinase [Grosmannia clavigera kw1407]EFX02459.1 pyridoxine kinase [Grosmannia clavigera kw1407]